jgi:hypothetical protein
MRSLIFAIYVILPTAQWSWDLLSLWQKLLPQNLSNGKARPARKADNLTASVSRLSRQCGFLGILQLCWPPRPVTEIALLFNIIVLLLYIITFSFGN